MALGTVCLSLLLLVVHHAHSSYVALAPSTFRPGCMYTVQLTVTNVPNGGSVTFRADILNSKTQSVSSGNVTINNGASGKLDIAVSANIKPDDGYSYTLKLVGSGGLTFTNTTSISADFTTKLVLIQTDKSMYKPGQLVRFRVLVVDKNLVPQKMAKNITIENPGGSTLVQHHDNGSAVVYEGTFQLAEFTGLGDWKIKVKAENYLVEEIKFTVEEYVLPKFEVSAKVNQSFLVKENGQSPQQTSVTVEVTATYTYGKGVKGTLILTTAKQTIRSEIKDPSGKKNIEIDLANELKGKSYGEININVSVTDETQRTYSTQAVVKIERSPVKIEFDKGRSDKVYRHGMPATFAVKVTDLSGSPLTDMKYKTSTLTITLTDYSDQTNTQTKTFFWSPGQPVVWTTANIMSTRDNLRLNASLHLGGKRYEEVDYNIQKYQTVGNAILDLRWNRYAPELAMGSSASFSVAVSDTAAFSSTFTYLIVSRGNIQAFGSASVGDNTVEVTTDMCPNGRLIVYGITATSSASATPEIIADSLKLKLEHCQDKKVVPRVTVPETETGTDATIRMHVSWTNPNRQDLVGEHSVYMLAVDKSLLLLQQSNDLTPAEVDEKLEKFDLTSDNTGGGGGPVPLGRRKRSIFPPFPQPDEQPTSTGQLLQNVGLEILSDTAIKRHHFPVMMAMAAFAVNRAPMMQKETVKPTEDAANEQADEVSSGETAAATNTAKVRKDFPDTWIWKTARTDVSGQLSMVERLPDSITSWVISAFAVRDNTELALTPDPFELRAVNPFFVSLNLPYSIRRSEKFQMRATVFNYKLFDVKAAVTLASSRDFKISGKATQTIQVKSKSSASVNFLIVAHTIKTIKITVTASGRKSDCSGYTFKDIVTRELIVKPEGVMRTKVLTYPVILTSEQPSFNKEINLNPSLNISEEIVPDSTTTIVKVTGDMMGNVLSNTDKLVTQPTGCGEQNMITTVPNIYAWTYLKAIKKITADFAKDAKKYMEEGYDKQTQQYRWTGCGYSAFGMSEQGKASTWLTAFVLRSFAQAKQFIPDTVDVDLLMGDANFLFKAQKADGTFSEEGKVFHDEMQGGTGEGQALSVYVTMCLLEARKYGFEIESSKLNSAVSYVKNIASGTEVKTNQFLAAITAYTLALNNAKDQVTVNGLIDYIKDKKNAPWMKSKDTEEPEMPSWYWRRKPGPSDVEITAYCILALNTIGKFADARELVMWLQEQQNGNGGFSSTQDTVMALQAISEYAVNFVGTIASSTVSITTLDPVTPTKTVTINSNNKALLQIIELPDETNRLRVNVQGPEDSFSVVKIVQYYYTKSQNETQPSGTSGNKLNISTNVRNTTKSGQLYHVQICLNKDPTWDYKNMMMVQFNAPSGFVMDNILEAKKQNPQVLRLEPTTNENLYSIYLNEPMDTCLEFDMEQTILVEDRKPGTLVYYAYYNTEYVAETDVIMPITCRPGGCCMAEDDCCMEEDGCHREEEICCMEDNGCCMGEDCPEPTTKKPTARAAHCAIPNRHLLNACVCLLLSLLIAV